MKKTALVTGASGGLGLSFVNIFANDGYDVILVARNGDRLEEIKKEIEAKYNVKATVVAVDLCSEDGAQRYMTQQRAQVLTLTFSLTTRDLVTLVSFTRVTSTSKSEWLTSTALLLCTSATSIFPI